MNEKDSKTKVSQKDDGKLSGAQPTSDALNEALARLGYSLERRQERRMEHEIKKK